MKRFLEDERTEREKAVGSAIRRVRVNRRSVDVKQRRVI